MKDDGIYGTFMAVGKKPEKLWQTIQKNQQNVRFADFCRLVEWFGFKPKGGKGSHKTYCQAGIQEIIDIQALNNEAKPYQIKQLIRLVRQYSLKGGTKP